MSSEHLGGAARRRQDIYAHRDAFTAAGDQTIIDVGGAAEQPVAPGLLPRDVPGFTGREHELACLEGLAKGGSVVVTAIDGTAGVGKTALAVHAAHRLLEAFPDGHLYADLRGYTAGQVPADPSEVLAVFLRRLNIPGDGVPMDLEEQSGLFRQLLSSRRILVILDNVATEAQVRPLLPGAGSSLVLITSRGVLAGLELDERINLDMLTGDETIGLLTSVVGKQRAAAEPDAVRKVGDLCGRLPLALRIAGQLLAAHPVWAISRLAELLADEQHRLDTLVSGDRQVRSAFIVSYRRLHGQDARLFRLLGLYPGPDFNSAAAGSLGDLEPAVAGQALDRLALAQLVVADAAGRFRLHDLLRLFAREICLAEDEELARAEALVRLIDHFEDLTMSLDSCVNPWHRTKFAKASRMAGDPPLNRRQAMAVFETELGNMRAVLTLASDQHQHQATCRIAEHMSYPLWVLWRPGDVLATNRIGFDAAIGAENQDAEARALTEIGKACVHLRQFDQAITCHRRSLGIYRGIGNSRGETQVLVNLGYANRIMRQFDQAVTCHQEALKISRRTGDGEAEAHALNNLGTDYSDLRQFDQAITCHQRALEIDRETGHRNGEGHNLFNLGEVYHNLRQLGQAVTCHQEAVEIYRETGEKHAEGDALISLGIGYRDLRQLDQAITCHRQAREIYCETGHRDAEGRALFNLGCDYQKLQQFDNMKVCFEEAAKAFRQSGDLDTAERLEEFVSRQGETGRPWWRRNWWRRKENRDT